MINCKCTGLDRRQVWCFNRNFWALKYNDKLQLHLSEKATSGAFQWGCGMEMKQDDSM